MSNKAKPSRIKSQEAAEGLKEQSLNLLSNIGKAGDEEKPIKLYGMELPRPVSLASVWNNPPKLAPEIISGILRQGHKMMLSGPSKAGKTFCLMNLAICIGSGKPWLGFPCKKGKVLYVNLEVDGNTAFNRFTNIGKALQLNTAPNVKIWNLRGFAIPFTDLAELIADEVQADGLSMVIVDPIYKGLTGSENDQEAVTTFCNALDLILRAGASVVYCHHHSKGIQGNKSSMDRASGSGVFARDADAILDMIEIFSTDGTEIDPEGKGIKAYQIDFTLREFKCHKPLKVLFDYPLHTICTDGSLDAAEPMTARKAGGQTRGQQQSIKKQKKLAEFETAYAELVETGSPAPTLTLLAVKLSVANKTIRNYVNDMSDYRIEKGRVYKVEKEEKS